MFDAKELPHPLDWEPDYDSGDIEYILRMVPHGNVNTIARTGQQYDENALRFIYEARRALHIQQNYGWYAKLNCYDRWVVFNKENQWVTYYQKMLDADWENPFTAICEAFDMTDVCIPV